MVPIFLPNWGLLGACLYFWSGGSKPALTGGGCSSVPVLSPCAVNTAWLSQLLFQFLTCWVLQHAVSDSQTHCPGMFQPYVRKWREETRFWCLCRDTLKVKWKEVSIFKLERTSICVFFVCLFVINLSIFWPLFCCLGWPGSRNSACIPMAFPCECYRESVEVPTVHLVGTCSESC